MKRETALKIIHSLPKEFKLEDLFEKLLFIDQVEKGIEQSEKNKTVPHEKVIEQFGQKWSKQPGRS